MTVKLRLVVTSDRVWVWIVVETRRKRAYNQVKIESQCHNWSHKPEGIEVGGIRSFPFLPISLTNPSLTRLMEWKTESKETTNHKAQNRLLWLVFVFHFCFDCDNLVFIRSYNAQKISREGNRNSLTDNFFVFFSFSSLSSRLGHGKYTADATTKIHKHR